MANVNIKPLGGQFGGFTPYGNLTTLRYTLQTKADGAPVNANADAAPLVINDVVRFQHPLPAGFVVEDLQTIVSDAFGAGVTADIGFAYADGEDDAAYPQSATAFGAGVSLAAIARIRTSAGGKLFSLPKDAYITLTVKGADIEEVGTLQLVIHGERLGAV